MEYYTYLGNITDLLFDENMSNERRFGQQIEKTYYSIFKMIEHLFITANDKSRIHQLGMKVLPRFSLGYALYVEESGRGRIECRSSGIGDDGRIGSKIQWGRGDISQENEN